MSNRASGRTTRLVDSAVQELFSTGMTIAQDHYGSYATNRSLADRIHSRMKIEHPQTKLSITIEGSRIIIKIVK